MLTDHISPPLSRWRCCRRGTSVNHVSNPTIIIGQNVTLGQITLRPSYLHVFYVEL